MKRYHMYKLFLMGVSVMIALTASARTETWVEGDGTKGRTFYDAEGNVEYYAETKDGVTDYYDTTGTRFQRKEQKGEIVKNTYYDEDGQVEQVEESWTEGDGTEGITVYDADGNVQYHKEEKDGVTDYYDETGTLYKKTAQEGEIVKNTYYDKDGHVSNVVESWTEGDGTKGSTVYDADGNVQYHTETNENGETSYYNKDGSPYVTKEQNSSATETWETPDTLEPSSSPEVETDSASNVEMEGEVPEENALAQTGENTNGAEIIYTGDSIIQKYPDGSVVLTKEDGSQVIKDGEGNLTFLDSKGNIVYEQLFKKSPVIDVKVSSRKPRVWAQYDTYSGQLSKGGGSSTYTAGSESQLAEGSVKDIFEGSYKGSVERAFMGERELAALERQETVDPSIFQQVNQAMKTAKEYVSATQRTVQDTQTRVTSVAGKVDTISKNFTGKSTGLKDKVQDVNSQVNKGTATLGAASNILGTNNLTDMEQVLTADNPFTVDNAMDAIDVVTQTTNNMRNNQNQMERRVDMWKK